MLKLGVLRTRRLIVTMLPALLLLLPSCAIFWGEGETTPRTGLRTDVDRFFRSFERALRSGAAGDVETFFSRDFVGGYEPLRDSIRDSQRAERVTDIQLIVNRILEADRRLNVQVRWNKAFLDNRGRPGKRSGTAELVLEPAGGSYRVLSIRGDSFL